MQEMEREGGNGERGRKQRENEEMQRVNLSQFPHFLSISSPFPLISSLSLHFLPLSPFPTSKFVPFFLKMLNTALLSRMSQKSQHTRYEEIILGRIFCEEALQVVPAWVQVVCRCDLCWHLFMMTCIAFMLQTFMHQYHSIVIFSLLIWSFLFDITKESC